ncbi:hypothetical protein [Citrobacter koseri]|uniref:hypothetical protein n=1 Tax=Citrobacter koseri TaxID=545 RepID=UPI0028BD25BB|nr:hypothetical protein [Citrobacter koseri]MDT7458354.1 hypothetical protein [Citrobacter koseri]
MKLIIKQYLSSLKERSELDVILPSLLSQMGLNVFARPIRGTNEYGVDIAAVGKINQDKECVYLFSVKSGNLTRSTWHSGATDQTLRPSLESILDSYIPHRLPPEHKNKPVVICLCFGGDIQTNVRQEVTGFTNKYTTDNISFEEWNGDKLSDLITEYLLNEDLLPQNWQSLLRKSIALLDEPTSSHQNFRKLVLEISKIIGEDDKSQVRFINTINICLWILYSWCRDENNIESAYISAESAILYVWDAINKNFTLKQKNSFDELISTYQKISEEYVQKCILPFCKNLHAISRAINTRCSIDLNIKLFDILGRVAIHAEWLLYRLQKSHIEFPPSEGENQEQLEIRNQIERISKTIQELVSNNPLLLSPYKDDQAIDISLAAHILLQNSNNDVFLQYWIKNLADRIMFAYKAHTPSIYMHTTTLRNYEEILEYKNDDNHELLREKYTQGSILYPTLMILAETLKNSELKADLVEFCTENLKHCTLQYWFPNHTSESYYYNNKEIHGSAFSEITETQYFSIPDILVECKSSSIDNLSAIKYGYAPLLLVASRHYRYPVPLHFFTAIIEDSLDTNKL